jgi:hypothetical protein
MKARVLMMLALCWAGSLLAPAARGAENTTVVGTITRIEAQPASGFGPAILVEGVLKPSGDPVKAPLTVPASAVLKLSSSGAAITFADLKVGQRVSAECAQAFPEPRVAVTSVTSLTVLDRDPAAEGLVAMLGEVRKANTWEEPDVTQQAEKVLFMKQERRGILFRKYVVYVVNVRPERVPEFVKAGFEAIKDFRLRLRWDRVSNINGWGTEVNGQVTRAWTDEPRYQDAHVADGLSVLRGFLEGWIPQTEKLYPGAIKHVWDQNSVSAVERGFVVDFSVSLQVYSVKDSQFVTKLSWSRRSGYYGSH